MPIPFKNVDMNGKCPLYQFKFYGVNRGERGVKERRRVTKYNYNIVQIHSISKKMV